MLNVVYDIKKIPDCKWSYLENCAVTMELILKSDISFRELLVDIALCYSAWLTGEPVRRTHLCGVLHEARNDELL